MSLKSIIKRYCPLPLFIQLKYIKAGLTCFSVLTEPLRKRKARRIVAEAEKYLPYYQDELSRKILRSMEEYIMTRNEDVFFKMAVEQEWYHHQPVSGTMFPGKKISCCVLIYDDDRNTKKIEQHKTMLSACGMAYRLMSLHDYVNGAEIHDDEVVVALTSACNEFRILYMTTRKKPSMLLVGKFWSERAEDQYVDCLSPRDNEIILDVGAFIGDTAIRFMKWGGDKIRHIYAFEFDPLNAEKCEENTKCYGDRVTVIKKGTWNKEQVLYINAVGSSGNNIRNEGNTKVQLVPIDSVMKDEHVTFIKMDIEGAELKSLMGAKNTIIKNHPRLAICIYHKPEDICEIPAYILSLVPEYKFYLRHYSSVHYETVLYAYCD